LDIVEITGGEVVTGLADENSSHGIDDAGFSFLDVITEGSRPADRIA